MVNNEMRWNILICTYGIGSIESSRVHDDDDDDKNMNVEVKNDDGVDNA